MDYRGGDR